MSNEDLINSGYKNFGYGNEVYQDIVYGFCDQFFQKRITRTKTINVYYFDKFREEDGGLDYSYEFELYDDSNDNYIIKKRMYGIDKNMSLEDIERVLLNEK